MNWFEKIDAYCERTHDGFWAEPLNAWTNAAFLVSAAVAVWVVLRIRRGSFGADWDLWLLPFWLVCIAVGSFLFHTWANRIGALADVGSIAAFILTYLAVFARRALGWGPLAVGAWWVALLGLSFTFPGMIFALVGDVGQHVGRAIGAVCAYAPTTASVFIAGLLVCRAGRCMAGRLLYLAGGVFIVSLTVTALDGPLCPVWPWGTHFVWHLLNATVLGLAMVGLGRALGMATKPG